MCALFAGIEIPGQPSLENVRRLDLLPIPIIRKMQRIGMAVHREYLWDLGADFRNQKVQLQKDIASYIPPERLDEFTGKAQSIEDALQESGESSATINASSSEQIGKLLFEMLQVGEGMQLRMTKSGTRLSTGKRQLELLRMQHPIVPLILRYRELDKLDSTYCSKLPNLAVFHPHCKTRSHTCSVCGLWHPAPSWRVHGELGTTRAATGRLNHNNPNLGNIPTRTDDGQKVQAGFIATGRDCGYDGNVIAARDMSQIELRCLAHLANEKSMIDIYQKDGDIHDLTARKVFKLDPSVKPDKIKHRMAAKRCIAKGQLVLTNHGLIAIEKVTCYDLVWDGVEWVSHDGVVSNGILPTIEHDGVRATLDHVVWAESGEMMYVGEAKRRGARLAVTGIEEVAVRFTADRKFSHLSLQRVSGDRGEMLHLQTDLHDTDRQYPARHDLFMQVPEEHQVLRASGEASVQTLLGNPAALHESEQCELGQLRRARDREQIQGRSGFRVLHTQSPTSSDLLQFGHRTQEQRRALSTWEFEAGDARAESAEQTYESLDDLQRGADRHYGFAPAPERRLPRVPPRLEAYLSPRRSRSALAVDTETQSAWEIQEEEVFDIVNAGPRHRFTVEGKLVSNTAFSIQNGTTAKGLYLQLVMDYGQSGIPVPEWLTPEWCEWFLKEFMETYEIGDWFQLMWYRMRRYGMAWDMFGRVRLLPEGKSFHRWISQAGERYAQNFPVTSTAAGQLKLGLGQADAGLEQLLDAEVWCWPLMTIHDSLMVECEAEDAKTVDDMLAFAMDTVMLDRETGEQRFRVPIKSDGGSMERWLK